MQRLEGRVDVKRLYGKINVVASGGNSGGPLQEKTAYPSHSKQIITPDEEFYGLLAVTVEPVPLFPACVMSLSSPYSENQYYYNHDQLPEIPAEVLEEYPYVFMVQAPTSARIYGCMEKPYVHTADDSTTQLSIPECGYVRYTVNIDASAWMQDAASKATGYLTLNGSGWALWWSNFDIPNGSADATEIYWYASGVQAEQPADATHFYYNGVRLPAIPADVLASYPKCLMYQRTNGSMRLLAAPNPWFFNNTYNLAVCTYVVYGQNPDTGAWEYETSYTDTGAFPEGTGHMWANHDIPNGSATATDIYLYGTPAVPDPVE